MKRPIRLALALVAFLPVRLFAGKYEVPKPIVTAGELAAAAAEVPVMRLDFTLPEEKDALESSDALSKRFFNQPEEMRYGGVTCTDWRKKWDLFATALINKAANKKLDAQSLDRCLSTLNYGRTRQTMCGFVDIDSFPEKPLSKEEQETKDKAARIEREKRQKDQDEHPERYYESNAIIPVGAYLAKYTNGDCWIIVCKWETIFDKEEPVVGLGHIMVWALDANTAEVVAYATCD